MNYFIWSGIFLCLSQSAMFSGLTIGFFGLSRLRLEVETAGKDKDAFRILQLRKDSNYLLATLLWGNVGVNVLLTLLTDSVLAGVSSFLFSTVGITICGEIFPQAYLSRNAISVGSKFIPLIKFYQLLLFPVAKPTAVILDKWLGKEGVQYFHEEQLINLIKKHIKAIDSDVDLIEGLGAINFLTLDDIKVADEGEMVDPHSIITLPFEGAAPVFPDLKREDKSAFMQQLHKTDKKWIVITDEKKEARLVLNADSLIRHLSRSEKAIYPKEFCHRPIIVTDSNTAIGEVIRRFTVNTSNEEDDVIHQDIILCWGDEKRIITGADILGRLLRGITKVKTQKEAR